MEIRRNEYEFGDGMAEFYRKRWCYFRGSGRENEIVQRIENRLGNRLDITDIIC